MKIRELEISNIAGYSNVIWKNIHPSINFLLGRNGAGKSTLLQAISLGLNYINGQRTEDLLTKTYPDAKIKITTTNKTWSFSFDDIRKSQTPKRDMTIKVLNFAENRQPKNIVGDISSELRQRSTTRYPNAISEIKISLSSSNNDKQFLAKRTIDVCNKIAPFDNWDWIESEIKKRGPKYARPVSCGQFDIVALALDLVRLQISLQDDEPVFVLLDNPEVFIHPSYQESLIEQIQTIMPRSQIFIASHSLRLLCHREPKSVFWLTRDVTENGNITNIKSVRDIEDGSKTLFYELYGTDINSAVLSLLHSFESPEYYKYLLDCALPSHSVPRTNPSADPQMNILKNHIKEYREPWIVLDFGAGQGDLLVAIQDSENIDMNTTYIAVTNEQSNTLTSKLAMAKEKNKISCGSKIIHDLSACYEEFDVIILCNTCHEISLPDLPILLAKMINRLRKAKSSKILIHETEILPVGEAGFIMWTPRDLQNIFSTINWISVAHEHKSFPGSVPLDTTTISLKDATRIEDLENKLIQHFVRQLPEKRKECLQEISNMRRGGNKTSGLAEAIRQRRLAFFVAQHANICLLEHEMT